MDNDVKIFEIEHLDDPLTWGQFLDILDSPAMQKLIAYKTTLFSVSDINEIFEAIETEAKSSGQIWLTVEGEKQFIPKNNTLAALAVIRNIFTDRALTLYQEIKKQEKAALEQEFLDRIKQIYKEE